MAPDVPGCPHCGKRLLKLQDRGDPPKHGAIDLRCENPSCECKGVTTHWGPNPDDLGGMNIGD